jgi:hypothetical protein
MATFALRVAHRSELRWSLCESEPGVRHFLQRAQGGTQELVSRDDEGKGDWCLAKWQQVQQEERPSDEQGWRVGGRNCRSKRSQEEMRERRRGEA